MLIMIKVLCLFVSVSYLPTILNAILGKTSCHFLIITIWASAVTAFIVMQWMI